ncbi:MAG: ATP-binding protein [Gammaproteobacteria bacterium]|nr:ATP-binding protein [Gammaproteobacteria bacterium]
MFEKVFIIDNVRYQYGFATTQDRIVEEWLLSYPKGRPQQWLTREWNESVGDHDWQLGNNLIGEKKLWKKLTRENALFLPTAVQLNSNQLRPIYIWFKHTLRTANMAGWSPKFTASLCQRNGIEKLHVMKFLQAADLGIDDIVVKENEFDYSVLPDNMPHFIKEKIKHEMKDEQLLEIMTSHIDTEGRAELFDIDDESHGTKKMFSLAGPWIDSLKKGYILVIDELNVGLHPLLLKYLINLFNNSKTNPKNAQLVFTTHETSILNQALFRRDQIWFCEKDNQNVSKLYPLADFSPRKGRENLEQAYLSGRYGSLPYVKPFENNFIGMFNGKG